MAAEAEAAREARAKVIAAEGEQKASRALREASEVIGDSPAALQLRYLQVMFLSREKIAQTCMIACGTYKEGMLALSILTRRRNISRREMNVRSIPKKAKVNRIIEARDSSYEKRESLKRGSLLKSNLAFSWDDDGIGKEFKYSREY